jgi:DNA-binding SARP family transcriptional activator
MPTARSGAPAVTSIRVFASGGVRLMRDDIEVDLGPVRPRIILATLVASGGSVVSVDELIDTVWADGPSATAVNQLHRVIGQLRRLFEPGLPRRVTGRWIVPVGTGYRLDVISSSAGMLTTGRSKRLPMASAISRKETPPSSTACQ